VEPLGSQNLLPAAQTVRAADGSNRKNPWIRHCACARVERWRRLSATLSEDVAVGTHAECIDVRHGSLCNLDFGRIRKLSALPKYCAPLSPFQGTITIYCRIEPNYHAAWAILESG
jgi:hypothetical protein